MKVKYWLLLILMAVLLPMCFYHRITHMDKDDLEWMRTYDIGDTVIFICDDLSLDTMFVYEKDVWNSLSPISRYQVFDEYTAGGFYNYKLLHQKDTLDGSFFINKEKNGQPVQLKFVLHERYALGEYGSGINQSLRVIVVNNETFDDCITIDDHNSSISRYATDSLQISYLKWSKKKGLIQYRYNNGQVYSRISESAIHR